MKPKRKSSVTPYIVALLIVVAATFVTCYWPDLDKTHSLAVYTVGVVIIAVYGGIWPSLMAVALSVAAFIYFIAPPTGWGMAQWQDEVRLASFVVISSFLSFLLSALLTTQRRLRSMMQRLSISLEGAKFGVWDLDLRTGVLWHSSSLEEIFGRNAERFARSYEVFLGYVHPDDRDVVHRSLTNAIESASEFQLQYRICQMEGQTRQVWTRGRIFSDSKGHPERLVAATADVTPEPEVRPRKAPPLAVPAA